MLHRFSATTLVRAPECNRRDGHVGDYGAARVECDERLRKHEVIATVGRQFVAEEATTSDRNTSRLPVGKAQFERPRRLCMNAPAQSQDLRQVVLVGYRAELNRRRRIVLRGRVPIVRNDGSCDLRAVLVLCDQGHLMAVR